MKCTKPFLLKASAPHSFNLFSRVASHFTHRTSYSHTTLQSIAASILRKICTFWSGSTREDAQKINFPHLLLRKIKPRHTRPFLICSNGTINNLSIHQHVRRRVLRLRKTDLPLLLTHDRRLLLCSMVRTNLGFNTEPLRA
jgi:hypothetical protein